MKIAGHAVAGTLESSDALVTLEPSDEIEIHIESTVIDLFEDEIRRCVCDTLSALGVSGAKVYVQDRGAFDCTLSARVETAVLRAKGQEGAL
ncbi:citrate lyase acyl carrier protein [Bacteroides sp. OttesenSCG-928-J23]|nr:citrate lyase acyl carrier protein [Bacteroides sp. OttesenSCG-928-J23]